MASIVLLTVVAIFLLIGVPIGICLAIGMLATLVVSPITNLQFISQAMYSGLDSMPLLAIPCFILAGSVMEIGGLSKRLINVANKLVGRFDGGLGTVAIVACLFFGAISGSAPATVAAIGSIMIPAMIERGYDKVYATGLIAVAGGLGVIVPPSIPMVIYGVATSTSIGSLFLAGFFPAIVVALSLGIVNYFISKKRGYKGTGEKFNLKGFLSACWEAKWALLMPVIILGGIYGGVFTPTEAAVISVAYGIVIGLFVYKELKFIDLYRIVDNNTSFVGGVMMTFAPAAALGSIFAMLQVPAAVSSALMTISTNKNIILLIINIFLVFVGMIVDTTSANIILSPLLLAILKPMGVDPIHLGIIMTLNLCIGFVTPPVAVNLFVASGMTKISVERIAKVAIPFIVALFAALMLVTYIPDISLGLLKIMKY